MIAKIISTLILFFFTSASILHAQYVIKGKIVGSDGNPMQRAAIQQLTNIFPYQRIFKEYPVNKDGTFLLDFTTPGFYRLRFCGLYHKPFGNKEFSLYLDQKDTIEIVVTLQKYPLKDSLKRVLFYTKPVNKYFTKRTEALIQPDSTFFIEVKADSDFVPYSIGGFSSLDNLPTSTGENCDLYKINESGDYYSVVKTKRDSTVKLEFDLKKHTGFAAKEKIVFIRLPEHTRKFILATDDFNERYNKYFAASKEAALRKKTLVDNSFHENYNWESELDDLELKIKKEKDPFLRKAYQISRFALTLGAVWYKPKDLVSRDLAEMALSEIEPDSPIWSFYPMGIIKAIGVLTKPEREIAEKQLIKINSKEIYQPFMDFYIKAADSHPDSSIKEFLYVAAIRFAKKTGFDDVFNKYFDTFKNEFSGSLYYDQYIKEFLSNYKLQIGNPVPDFEFTSVTSNAIKVSRNSMLGKKYIINFWAAWCGPCSGSIEALRNMQNRYGRNNFQIISVSLSFKKEDIPEYQKTHPMPWFSTYIDMKKDEEGVLKKFEVQTIPKEILVDERGYIIVVNDLDKIMEILSKK